MPPVVGKNVIAPLAQARRRPWRTENVAAKALQRVDDLPVEILSQCLLGNAERFEVVGANLQRRAVEIKHEAAVFIEQDGVPGSRPNLDLRCSVAKPGAEYAGNDDHRRGIGDFGADAVEPSEIGTSWAGGWKIDYADGR